MFIGAVMLAAAAAFIYFEEPQVVRIASGIVFILGAIVLYVVLSRTVEEADAELESEAPVPAGPGNAARKRTQPTEHQAAAGGPGDEGDTQYSPPSATPPDHRGAEIPPEFYAPRQEELPSDDPRAEFDYLANRLLLVLKEHLLAHTVALFWINRDREQIIIGEYVTDSRNFTTARRLSLGSDLVSRVGIEGRPEILAELSSASEQDLAIYYDSAEGIQSFVGVPVFFHEEIIAVISADSKVPDSFGPETVSTIGKFTGLLSTLLASYNQKFDLAADSRVLAVLDTLQAGIRQNMDAYGIASEAAKAVTQILDWDYVAVILHNPERQVWTVVRSLSRSANLPYVHEGVTVDIEGSVLKTALEGTAGVIIDAPKAPAYRFHEKEAVNAGGQICAIPLVTQRKYYGLVIVEYRESHQYAQQDLDVLARIAALSANAMEITQLHEYTRSQMLIDEETRTSSRTLLLRRLREEQARLREYGGSAVYFLAGLDSRDELIEKHGRHEVEHIMFQISETLKPFLKEFDVIGRFDSSRLGLLLMHSSSEDAYLRGEKMRKAVASTLMSHEGQSYAITVSIAGCTLSQTSDVDHIMKLATQALDRAVSDGGNCVKVV